MAFTRLLQSRRVNLGAAMPFVLDLPAFGDRAPTLLVRFAGEGNDGYMNESFKAARTLGAGQVTAQRLRTDRELDVPIYAEHVLTGWESVYEDDPEHDGKVRPAVFDLAKAQAFLLELAREVPHEFNRMRNFAQSPSNFRTSIASAEDLGKG
ncbi:MAG: hypothetical protein H0U12_07130 [Thermoleophilaceae bacterium]|nr:hypothetical protein [Thermoleophilaceae bacterium]